MNNEPITTIEVEGRTFKVFTLPSYDTAYFFCAEFGRVKHFQTLRQLKNAIRRALRAGKIS